MRMQPPVELSVIVNFHNMRREAPRTLLTLASGYQRDVEDLAYEVVALDNGSTERLDEAMVRSAVADRGRYVYRETESVSPVEGINAAVRESTAEWIMCLIDGARMASPGVLRHSMLAARAFSRPFVYTLAMHLGPQPQNESILNGYDQSVEDGLLDSVDWRHNGYSLFGVSSVALSSRKGFFSDLLETNCFMMRRDDYLRLGGLSEEFQAAGGGLVNLDFFNRVHEDAEISPVMLLGEATFHQFHGGVATNVPMSRHPWEGFAAEYRRIRGRDFASVSRPPVYLGTIPPECRGVMRGSLQAWDA